MDHWAQGYDRCQSCGTAERKHKAKGLCALCYGAASEAQHKSHITRRKGSPLPTLITKDHLEEKYNSGQSLIDIARHYNCTRQYVHKLLKHYGIARRGQGAARNLAMERGKIAYLLKTTSGQEKLITPQNRYVNEDFFRTWSPGMAWVLGVVFTDGCVSEEKRGRVRVPRLQIVQKEPELLDKVRALMECNVPLTFTPKRGIAGPLHRLPIRNQKIYEDLIAFGLQAPKSYTITFPNMPSNCLRHFIRGCWDGDGSMYFERGAGRRAKPIASYVSGSRSFVESIVAYLHEMGLPRVTIHTDKRSTAFYIKYHGGNCAKLYHLFYDGVDQGMYLNRKHAAFKIAADLPLPPSPDGGRGA